jgi:hypothetical protein
MKILPFGNNILVKPISLDTGFLTATNGMMTSKCTAEEVGPECDWVKKGDVLICNYWAPNETEVDSNRLFFVQENSESILAKIEE